MSLTAANATILLTIPNLYPIPQQLQGFAADDVFDTDAIRASEVLMGVDGKLSGGFVYVEVPQNYSIQADSPSALIFDNWYANQRAQQDVFNAYGIISLPGLGQKWAVTNGFLTNFNPIPAAKRLIQPRRFTITWESVSPAPV